MPNTSINNLIHKCSVLSLIRQLSLNIIRSKASPCTCKVQTLNKGVICGRGGCLLCDTGVPAVAHFSRTTYLYMGRI